MMISNRFFVLAVLLVGLESCGISDDPNMSETQMSALDTAENAYFQLDLTKAEKLFTQVWEDKDATLDDRTNAGQVLMRIAWQVHEDAESAQLIMSSLEELNYELSASFSRFSSILTGAANYEAAMAVADKALMSAETRPERNDANYAYAQAALKQAKQQIFSGHREQVNLDLLAIALQRVQSVLETQNGLAAPSLVALEAALILDRHQDALHAWRSFYHIRSADSANSVLKQAEEVLARLLGEVISPELNMDYRLLALTLQASRQFDAAALVARLKLTAESVEDSEIAELLAYQMYLDKISSITHSFYRRAANGEADDAAYDRAFDEEAKSVWFQLDWGDRRKPGFSRERFLKQISQRFGTEVSFKRLSGFYGVHMGHRVADEDYRIEQYDKTAQLRFISLDSMVSNGYTSWFWDGRAEVGGWAENPVIVQVRSAYSNGGITAWRDVTDQKTRNRIEREIKERSVSDIEIARRNPYAYLPGLAQRMRQRGYENLLSDLSKQGLRASALQLTFISEVERISFESSIIAHEGRHAIESKKFWNKVRFGNQKEFLAKLSEVAFSSTPKLAICGGILVGNIGDSSSHGTANKKIMEGLVKWMNQNIKSIKDLDTNNPLLPQLDLLSDEQLRDAFRSLDYLAES